MSLNGKLFESIAEKASLSPCLSINYNLHDSKYELFAIN